MEGDEKLKKTLQLKGLSCENCAGHVKESLQNICGVKSVDVNLEKQQSTVNLDHDVEEIKFKEVIEKVGYEFLYVI
jgi:copper chaperone CopZ